MESKREENRELSASFATSISEILRRIEGRLDRLEESGSRSHCEEVHVKAIWTAASLVALVWTRIAVCFSLFNQNDLEEL